MPSDDREISIFIEGNPQGDCSTTRYRRRAHLVGPSGSQAWTIETPSSNGGRRPYPIPPRCPKAYRYDPGRFQTGFLFCDAKPFTSLSVIKPAQKPNSIFTWIPVWARWPSSSSKRVIQVSSLQSTFTSEEAAQFCSKYSYISKL